MTRHQVRPVSPAIVVLATGREETPRGCLLGWVAPKNDCPQMVWMQWRPVSAESLASHSAPSDGVAVPVSGKHAQNQMTKWSGKPFTENTPKLATCD